MSVPDANGGPQRSPSGAGVGTSPSGFRHLDDRIVHRGYLWHVAVGRFAAPDGSEFERDIVRSPGAVGAVPLWFEGDEPWVVLVRQYRAPVGTAVLEIPAGMRDIADEPTELTAARELEEEVGVRAGRLEPLQQFLPSVGMTDAVVHLFLATELVTVERATHGPEEHHSEVVRMPFAAALDLVLAGEIVDAKTVIALLLVEHRLRRGVVDPTIGR